MILSLAKGQAFFVLVEVFGRSTYISKVYKGMGTVLILRKL